LDVLQTSIKDITTNSLYSFFFPSFVEGMREKTQSFGENWLFSRK